MERRLPLFPPIIEYLRKAEIPLALSWIGWRNDAQIGAYIPLEPGSGIVIKTPEMAKGYTVDAVLVHRADHVPRLKTRSSLLAEAGNNSDGLAQAYLAISRPKYVYIAASYQRLPEFDEHPRSGRDYLDMRTAKEQLRFSLNPS